ncbi:MAG: GNAT family N-acetyltransferase [Clostridium sp.]|nr:GNAT family N-acetyltransferase [Clostridium sp.]
MRELKREDEQDFIEMMKTFYKSKAVIVGIPEIHMKRTFEAIMDKTPYANAFILDYKDEVAGYVMVSMTWSNEAGGLVIWVEELFIKSKFRGLGLGGRAIELVRKRYLGKVKRFRLEISKDNKNVGKLYRRKGFKPLEYMQMSYDVLKDEIPKVQ